MCEGTLSKTLKKAGPGRCQHHSKNLTLWGKLSDTGNVILKANNDITIDSAIDASGNNNAGNLELQAGRSIDINANITVEGSFTAIANDDNARASFRDGGDATFNSNGFTINTADSTASTHDISISYQGGPGEGFHLG